MTARVAGAAGGELNDAGGVSSVYFATLGLAIVISTAVRRRNAVRAQLFFGLWRNPICGPRGRQLSFHFAL